MGKKYIRIFESMRLSITKRTGKQPSENTLTNLAKTVRDLIEENNEPDEVKVNFGDHLSQYAIPLLRTM